MHKIHVITLVIIISVLSIGSHSQAQELLKNPGPSVQTKESTKSDGKMYCKSYTLVGGVTITVCRFSSGYVSISVQEDGGITYTDCNGVQETIDSLTDAIQSANDDYLRRLIEYYDCIEHWPAELYRCGEMPTPPDLSDATELLNQLLEVQAEFCTDGDIAGPIDSSAIF